MPQSPSSTPRPKLAGCIITLAGTADEDPGVDALLNTVSRLAADTVAPVAYASITALRGGGYTTVAASSDLIKAVDDAQYAPDGGGPCVAALDTGVPVLVPDITAVMSWPGFCEVALGMGLVASVSIPLCAGRGAPVAVLNLYGHDTAAMSPLVHAVTDLYDPPGTPDGDSAADPEPGCDDLDPGSAALLEGLRDGIAARATIQTAIAALAARTRRSADDAYALLRLRAAESGASLTAAATALISRP